MDRAFSTASGAHMVYKFQKINHKYLHNEQTEQCRPGIATKCCMMECVEAVVVSDAHVSRMLQQQRQHVITLLTDSIMQWGVTLRVLHTTRPAFTACFIPNHTTNIYH